MVDNDVICTSLFVTPSIRKINQAKQTIIAGPGSSWILFDEKKFFKICDFIVEHQISRNNNVEIDQISWLGFANGNFFNREVSVMAKKKAKKKATKKKATKKKAKKKKK